MNENQKRALCLNTANELVEKLRAMNRAYYARTGEPPRVSEADYMEARDQIESVMLRVAGLKPRAVGEAT